MKREYFIGLDTHGSFCEMAAVTALGNLVRRGRCATSIAALRAMIEKVPRPRHLTFEEGPLANWLYRNLKDQVDQLTVAEPRRNRLIAKDGDMTTTWMPRNSRNSFAGVISRPCTKPNRLMRRYSNNWWRSITARSVVA